MKKLIFLLPIVFFGCRKCSTCTTTTITSVTPNIPGYPKTEQSSQTVCGSQLTQIDGQSYTSTTTSNGSYIKSTATTKCQ